MILITMLVRLLDKILKGHNQLYNIAHLLKTNRSKKKTYIISQIFMPKCFFAILAHNYLFYSTQNNSRSNIYFKFPLLISQMLQIPLTKSSIKSLKIPFFPFCYPNEGSLIPPNPSPSFLSISFYPNTLLVHTKTMCTNLNLRSVSQRVWLNGVENEEYACEWKIKEGCTIKIVWTKFILDFYC